MTRGPWIRCLALLATLAAAPALAGGQPPPVFRIEGTPLLQAGERRYQPAPGVLFCGVDPRGLADDWAELWERRLRVGYRNFTGTGRPRCRDYDADEFYGFVTFDLEPLTRHPAAHGRWTYVEELQIEFDERRPVGCASAGAAPLHRVAVGVEAPSVRVPPHHAAVGGDESRGPAPGDVFLAYPNQRRGLHCGSRVPRNAGYTCLDDVLYTRLEFFRRGEPTASVVERFQTRPDGTTPLRHDVARGPLHAQPIGVGSQPPTLTVALVPIANLDWRTNRSCLTSYGNFWANVTAVYRDPH